jgi:small subunit ribosomal protein S6
MRSYEVMFIAHPDLDDTSLTALVDKAKGWVAAAGGAVTQVDLWGRRRLAYPIRKQNEGQYILMQTQMTPAATRELERSLRLTEQVMRFQVIRSDEA